MTIKALSVSLLGAALLSLSCLLQAQQPAAITGVTAGTDLTGGGTSGVVTLNLDTTKVPQLATANTFTANQTMKGSLSVNGSVAGSGFKIGSNLFAYGSYANANAFFGFAGNSTMTGGFNTASGYGALLANTNGNGNTATGWGALASNTTGVANLADGENAFPNNVSGSLNTAVGVASGSGNVAGNFNTFVGFDAGASADPLTNAAAIGAYATVGENNAMILGGTTNRAVTVGIGTATPYIDYALDVETVNSNGTINGGVVVNANGGNLYLGMTNTTHKFRVDTNGVTYADGGFQASGADFAESVAVRGQRSAYEPGDVLAIDRNAKRGLTLSHYPYARLVAGIYSTKPGLLATPRNIDDPAVKTSEVPLAVVGIVPCKVTTENGAIHPGDLLVTSSRPGYAMKGTDARRLVGAVVGKALEPLPKGMGMIQVLVTLQ